MNRRILAGGIVALALVATVATTAGPLTAPARAQTTPGTLDRAKTSRIELAQQDAVTPVGGDLTISLAISNPPPGATVNFAAYQPIISRRSFEAAMADGALGSALGVVSMPLEQTPPDDSGLRTFTLGLQDPAGRTDPKRLPVRRAGVYPLVVSLLNADDVAVSTFRTALVVSEADGRTTLTKPLEVAWVWPIEAAPSFLPSGEPDKDVIAALRPDGRLGRQAAALRSAPDVPVTIAPVAETIDAWATAGHDDVSIDAGADAFRTNLGTRQVLDGTYVPLDLTMLLDHGLTNAVEENLQRGEQVLQNAYGSALDKHTRLLQRPSSAALARLAAAGTDHVVLDGAALLAPTNEPRFTPAQPVNVRYSTPVGPGTVAALATEPGVQQFLTVDAPAALRAQLVLADLAVVATEAPSVQRVVPVVNPGNLDAPPTLFTALLDGLRDNPYLRPVTVTEAFATVAAETSATGAPTEREIAPGPIADAPFSASAYAGQRTRVGAFGELTRSGDPALGAADRSLLASVSSAWPADAARARATAHLHVVDRVIDQFLHRIDVPNPRTITLTSRSGEIPLTFRNGTGYPIHLRASLSSEKLFFPDGRILDLELPPRSTTVRVAVETRTSGTFPLDLEVSSTDGVLAISQRRLEVRSTFVSTVGIVLMGSAVLFLAVWWGIDLRRRGRRRTRPETS